MAEGILTIKGKQVSYTYMGSPGKYSFRLMGIKDNVEKLSLPSPELGSREIVVFHGLFMGVRIREITPGKLEVVKGSGKPAAPVPTIVVAVPKKKSRKKA